MIEDFITQQEFDEAARIELELKQLQQRYEELRSKLINAKSSGDNDCNTASAS